MFKVVFIISLFLIASSFILPYVVDLFFVFSSSGNSLTNVFDYMVDLVSTFFNSLSNYTYIMLFIGILVFLAIIFYFLNKIGGDE